MGFNLTDANRLTFNHMTTEHADFSTYWSAVFDQCHQPILLLNANVEIQQSNRAWYECIGKATKSCSVFFKDYIYQEDVLTLQYVLLSRQRHKQSIRLCMQEQVHWFDVHLQPLHDVQTGRFQGWCVFCEEQTQNIRQKERREAQQRSLNDLLSRLPVMLYRSRNDWNWTMEYVSHACVQLTGYDEAALINTPLYGQLIHPDDQQIVWDSIQYGLQHHTVFHLYYRLVQANQQMIYVQEIGQGLYSESDMVLGIEGAVFCVAHD